MLLAALGVDSDSVVLFVEPEASVRPTMLPVAVSGPPLNRSINREFGTLPQLCTFTAGLLVLLAARELGAYAS